MPQDDRLAREVYEELWKVRGRGIYRLDELSTGKTGRILTPSLEAAAKVVPGYKPSLTRSQMVKLLLSHVIPCIDEDHPCRKWLPASFGLTKATQGSIPKLCREEAAKIAGYSVDHFERTVGGPERNGLRILAVQIVADCFSDSSDNQAVNPGVEAKALPEGATIRERASTFRHPPAVRPVPGVVGRQTWHERMPRWSNPYVPRHAYHDKIVGFLTSSQRRALLVGLPGMGKTRLACEVAVALAEAIGSEVVQLQGDTENTMLLSMQSELNRRETRLPTTIASFMNLPLWPRLPNRLSSSWSTTSKTRASSSGYFRRVVMP